MDERGTPAAPVQNVLAVNGIAYGVIGADLHVFRGSGIPLYRLANWQRARRPDDRIGRRQELEQLLRWRDSGPRLQLRWLHGAAAQGKSRLADQLAIDSAQAGWKVAVAMPGARNVQEPVPQDLRPGASGCLVIIDDADRWPLSHLTWLLSNSLFHQAVPTRVLLLARGDDAWPGLRAAVACLQAGTSRQFLEPVADEPPQR